MDNYVVTHLHSDLSNGVTNIDSVTKFDDYILKAKECGMKALCFTEHGSVFSWVNKKKHIEDAGMKYIHGIEAYVTESLDKKERDNYHCVLIATNYEAVKEINKLSSISFNRNDGHFYYAPRITFDELINTSDNIIIQTACLGGILHNGNDNLKSKFIKFLIKNKHRCYLEIQHHNVEDQINYNKYLYKLSKETGVSLIVGTDTHALNKAHLDGRKILQRSKNVRFDNEDNWDLTFKTYDELIKCYEKQNSLPMDIVRNAIENTNKLAESVEEFKLSTEYKYPHLWENPLELFKKKIKEGVVKRGVNKYSNFIEYKHRINYELKAYIHNQAIDFMLLMTDIIEWCKDNDIEVGYGRGSVNGSVIAWLLGITEMDSIKHELNFDRFMNVERVSLSDIDTDFPPSRIEDVKQYIFSKHGLYCSDIVTFNTIADKGAIRDVGRAFSIPLDEIGMICTALDNDSITEDIKQKYSELFKYVDIVKGTIVSVGSHPCGCVVSPDMLDNSIGLFTTSTSNYPISQIYMKEIDGLNYVKLDLLRLDTIELINETCKIAGIERLTPDNVDINDDKVWNSIRDNTIGIFQWEGNTGNTYIKKLLDDSNIEKLKAENKNIDKMTLLSIGNSAIRPAGASYREDLASGVVRKIGSKPIDDFLSNTFGYLVFQEQIISFLYQYCGFTMGEADVVRRHFSKKQFTSDGIAMTELDTPIIKNGGYMKDKDGNDKTDHYIEGFVNTMYRKYGTDKNKSEMDIEAFLQVIVDASRYLFSLNHSQPYSYEGYVAGYLRKYYPLEFLTTALNINKDKEEKTKELCSYAKSINIEISPPKFRHSKSGYFFDKDKNVIYKGIGSIKFMNDAVADELYKMKDNKYDTFLDLLMDIETKTTLNSRQLNILICVDYFVEFGDINKLLRIVELKELLYGKKTIKKVKIKENDLDESVIAKYGHETPSQYNQLDNIKILDELIGNIEYKPLSIKEKLDIEKDILGIITTKDSNISKRIYYVSELEVLKSIVNVKLYEVYSGITREVKMWTNSYNRNPFNEKDVLYIVTLEKKNKKEPTGEINPITGKKIYVDILDKFEFWLSKYNVQNKIEVNKC